MHINDNHFFLSSTPDFAQFAKPLLRLGITYFNFSRSYQDGSRISFSTHPEHIKYYFDHEYYLVGNVEGKPDRYTEQVLFWSSLPKQFIYDDIPRARGIDHGIFIVQPGANYCDFYAFAADKHNDRIINVYLNYFSYLKNFILNFEHQTEHLLHQAHKHLIILPYHEDQLDFINANQFDVEILNPLQLSNRQLDCVRLLLRGKVIKQIARSLNLSPRTVETYLNNIKRKLNCQNKSELIIKLMTCYDYLL